MQEIELSAAIHLALHQIEPRDLPLRLAAGVTGKLWEISDIVALIEAKEAEKPIVRGPYKTRAISD